MTHIGFTGTRLGMTYAQRANLTAMMGQVTRKYGGAVTGHHGDDAGSDAEFHNLCRDHGWRVVGHPPDNRAHRAFCEVDESREELPYLERNGFIVDEGRQGLFAAPAGMQEEVRSGTWATVRCARRLGLPVVILWPRDPGAVLMWRELRLAWATVLLGWITTTIPDDCDLALRRVRELAWALLQDDQDDE